MDPRLYADEELVAISQELFRVLRPKRLPVGAIRRVLQIAIEALDYIVFQEGAE